MNLNPAVKVELTRGSIFRDNSMLRQFKNRDWMGLDVSLDYVT